MKSVFIILIAVLFLSGCLPSEIFCIKPNGEKIVVLYYPGGTTLDDLLIIGGKNYFGKGQYQIDDPVGDVGFKFKSGARIQAECVQQGKNIVGQQECKEYRIYRSSFSQLPENTIIKRPSGV